MNRNVILAVVILAVLAVVAFGVANRGGGGAATEPIELTGVEDMQELARLAQGITMGDAEAPVTIAEFGDFQCPACKDFAGSVKPQIDLAYVQNGQARFVFYDFPLTSIHPHAFLAARAARCALDQERFWEYHDALFRYQSRWSSSSNPPVRLFEDYAAEVGLEQDAFSSCLRSDRHADVVTANMRLGQELGATGTPSVIVHSGGMTRRVANNSFAGIQEVVESFAPATADSAGGRP